MNQKADFFLQNESIRITNRFKSRIGMLYCLEVKGEYYQNCSVLCCVRQLCTMAHKYEQVLKCISR